MHDPKGLVKYRLFVTRKLTFPNFSFVLPAGRKSKGPFVF